MSTLKERISLLKVICEIETDDRSISSTPAPKLTKSQRGQIDDVYERSDSSTATTTVTRTNKLDSNQLVYQNISEQPHKLEGGYLKSYQLESLQWLLNIHVMSKKHQEYYNNQQKSKKFDLQDYQVNAILADEMGLGKTIQTIALLAAVKQLFGIKGTHLVVVPKSTIPQWQSEFQKWAPFFRVLTIIGDYESRGDQINQLIDGNIDVVITTYDVLRIEDKVFYKFDFSYLILDEGHKLKSQETNVSEVVRNLSVDHKLILTGTPIQNDLHELWSLLNTLNPYLFDNPEEFVEVLQLEENVEQLTEILQLFLLRREKKDVEQLPPKHEFLIHCPMTSLQKDIYKGALLRDLTTLQSSLNSNNNSLYKNSLVNILMLLRKAADHPYLFRGIEPEPFMEGEHLINSCGKMVVLSQLLLKIINVGEKVLIFCQMTSMMDIIDDFMRMKTYKYVRIDGSTELHDRAERMAKFMKDPKCQIFLLSTRAGSLGLNLTAANHVIIYQQDFNPQVDHQAVARAYRILQTKDVFVYRLLTENSVDIRIYERAKIKMQLDELIIQNGNFTGQGKDMKKKLDLDKRSLFDMISFKTEELFTNAEEQDNKDKTKKYDYNVPEIQFSDELLEKVLIEGKQHNDDVEKKVEQTTNQITSVIQQLSSDGKLDSMDVNKMYMFEGEDFGKERMKKLAQQLYKESNRNIDNDEDDTGVEFTERRQYPNLNKYKRSSYYKPDFWFLEPRVYQLQQKVFDELKKINDIFQAQTGLDYESYLVNLASTQPHLFADRYADFTLPGLSNKELQEFKSYELKYCQELDNYQLTRSEFKSLVDSLDYDIDDNIGCRVIFKHKQPQCHYEKQNAADFAFFFTQNQLDEYIYVEPRKDFGSLPDLDLSESFKNYQKMKDSIKEISFQKYEIFIQKLLSEIMKDGCILQDVLKLQQKIDRMKLKRQNLSKKIQIVQSFADHIINSVTIPKFFASQRQGFTQLQDNMMMVGADLFGYGNWEILTIFLKKMEMFRFDFWFRGREAGDIGSRIDVQIKKLQKKL